jgi:hypothetical protein
LRRLRKAEKVIFRSSI